jgi:hypothetical protein
MGRDGKHLEKTGVDAANDRGRAETKPVLDWGKIKAGFTRLDAKADLTIKQIANFVGCSQPTIHAWKTGKVKAIALKDAVALGLLDQGFEGTQQERISHWVEICGYTLTWKQVSEEIAERTSLSRKLEKKLAEIKDLAGAKGVVNDDQFYRALSCYLGQTPFLKEVEEWQCHSNGTGTVAFFWRCEEIGQAARKIPSQEQSKNRAILRTEELCARFKQPSLKMFIEKLIDPRSAEVTGHWKPDGVAPKFEVLCLVQINVHAHSAAEKDHCTAKAKAKLEGAIRMFHSELALGASNRGRFKVFVTTTKHPHPADCWVFASKAKTFGALVSTSSELVRTMEQSRDPEIKANPYAWSGQVIHLNDPTVVKHDYLDFCFVGINDGQLTPKSEWTFLPTATSGG